MKNEEGGRDVIERGSGECGIGRARRPVRHRGFILGLANTRQVSVEARP
jgi:hypothetical protein